VRVTDTNSYQQVGECIRSAKEPSLATVKDPGVPREEVLDVCSRMLTLVSRRPQWLEPLYPELFQPVFARWTNDATAARVEAKFYIDYAWLARGGGYADTVTEKGGELFTERLLKAKAILERAYELDPTDAYGPTQMITVSKGLGEERGEMEKWFARAMVADPKNSRACKSKISFLAPRWGGTAEELRAFGHQLVTNTAWGGDVPLCVLNAHGAIAADYCRTDAEKLKYWAAPGVYKDVKAGFERYYALHPSSTNYHQDFAKRAYIARDWDTLGKQVALFGPKTNYALFGGEASFKQVMADLKAHTRQ
jgi:hypothetical protein